MSNYQIAHATPGDAATIAQFNQAMALETENKVLADDVIGKGVARMLRDDNLGFYLVCHHDSEVIACLGVTSEWSDWRNGLFWWIQSVYVAPEHRQKGVFSSLYARVKGLADKNEEVCGIRLYVEEDNGNAQSTYRRLGMKKTAYYLLEEEF